MALEGENFIIVGIQSIDDEYGNIKNIAYEIAKKNRVVFVHTPVDRISSIRLKDHPVISKKLQFLKKKNPLVAVTSNLWSYYPQVITESINWIKFPFLFDFLNKINSKRFALEIVKAASSLKFDKFILINDNDFFKSFHLKDFLPPHINAYYMRDFFTYMDYWKTHGRRLEPQLIAKADLAITNSTYLSEYCRQFNKNSFYVGQGCDLTHFCQENVREKPEDLKSFKGPIIGYIGALVSVRLDIELICAIAERDPQWNVILIGSQDEEFLQSRLHHIPNVHFLGPKPIAQAPTYLNYFDVCINPQKINKMTVGNYPLKIDEYLAMGKPVVATATETMKVFDDYVYLAAEKDGFANCIQKALNEPNKEMNKNRRRAFAASHTWENNVEEIYNALQSLGKFSSSYVRE